MLLTPGSGSGSFPIPPAGPSATPVVGIYAREIDVTDIPLTVQAALGVTNCLGGNADGDGTIIKAVTDFVKTSTVYDGVVVPTGNFMMTNLAGAAVLINEDFAGNYGWMRFRGAGYIRTTLNQKNNLGADLSGDLGGRFNKIQLNTSSTSTGKGGVFWQDFSLNGPTLSGNYTDGEMRNRGWGMGISQKGQIARVSVQGWHAGFFNNQSNDHSILSVCEARNNWFGVYFYGNYNISNGNTANGDQIFYEVFATANACSSWGFDPAAILFDSEIIGGHNGTSPYIFYREAGPKGDKTVLGTAKIQRVSSNGLVKLDTGQDVVKTRWVGQTLPAAYGFHVGDWVDLSKLVVTGGGALSNSTNVKGQVTAISTGPTGVVNAQLEVTMAVPKTGDGGIASGTAVTGSLSHLYNQARWLDDIIMFDSTWEGPQIAHIFCEEGDSWWSGIQGTLVPHGVEVVGSNGGHSLFDGVSTTIASAYSTFVPVQITRVVREAPDYFPDWDVLSNPSATPTPVQYARCTAYMPGGTSGSPSATAVRVWDPVFFDVGKGTITSGQASALGQATDDAAPSTGFKQDGLRCRGMYYVYAITDNGNAADNEGCRIQYLQLYTTKGGHTYGARQVGTTGSTGSAGCFMRVTGTRMSGLYGWACTWSAQVKNAGGEARPDFHFDVEIVNDCNILVGGELQVPIFRMPFYANVVNTIVPVNSEFKVGRQTFYLSQTAPALSKGAVLESINKSNVQPYGTASGSAYYVGINVYKTRANDFAMVLDRGTTRGAYDYKGVLSKVLVNSNVKLAVDPLNPGYAKVAVSPGETVIGVSTAQSVDVSPFFGMVWGSIYQTEVVIGEPNAAPAGSVTYAQNLVPTGTTKTTTYTAAPGEYVPADLSGGGWTLTLPTAPADGTRIGTKVTIVGTSGTPAIPNVLTVQAGGTDLFNKPGGGATMTLSELNEGKIFQYQASRGLWYVTGTDFSFVEHRKPRVVSQATAASWAINADITDEFVITGQTGAVTVPNPSGSPVDGQRLIIRARDDGVAIRAINFNGGQWRAGTSPAFPTTTTLGKTMYIEVIRNAADTKWDLLRVNDGF